MKVNVYLDDYIITCLTYYGYLDIVINKILEEGFESKFPLTDLPTSPPRNKKCKQYCINITNNDYIESSLNRHPVYLRRIIYYFVDNEVYNELGWKPSDELFVTSKYIKYWCNCIDNVYKLNLEAPDKHKEKIQQIYKLLYEVKDVQ